MAVFIHSTSIFASEGRSGRIRATSASTRCLVTCMSVPQAKFAVISVEPREVVDSTRPTPGTRRIASSRGRVTVGIIHAAGSSPASAMTLIRGNVTEGKIEDGSRIAIITPAAARITARRPIAVERSRENRMTFTGSRLDRDDLPLRQADQPRHDDRLTVRERWRDDLGSTGVLHTGNDVDPVRLAIRRQADPRDAGHVVAKHGGVRYDGCAGPFSDEDARGPEEADRPPPGRAGEVHANLSREVRGVGAGQNGMDGAGDGRAPSGKLDRGLLARKDAEQIRLRDVGQENERGGVGDGQDLLVFRDSITGARGV